MKKLSVLFAIICIGYYSFSQIPQTISFQGFVTNSTGDPEDGTESITFSIYRVADNTQVWTETHPSVTVSSGLYSVELGSITPFSFAFDQAYQLEITVDTEVLSPRVNLTSSAFAIGASGVFGDSNVFPSDGNVGIGTTSPTQTVDVRGASTNASGNLVVGNSDLSHQLLLFSGNGLDPSPFIGWNDGDPLRFAEFAASAGGFAERMRIQEGTGFVGIGTANPSAELDIVGNNGGGVNTRVQNTNANGWSSYSLRNDQGNSFSLSIGGSTASNGPNDFYIFNSSSSGVSMLIDGVSDNVGIGTSSPLEKLHVNGNARINSILTLQDVSGALSEGGELLLAFAGDDSAIPQGFRIDAFNDGNNRLRIFDNTNVLLDLEAGTGDLSVNGNAGIGRSASTNALEVEGNASKTSAGDWLANSDRRIKTDIRDIENSLELVKALRPVKFKYSKYWKEKNPSLKDHYYYNFIAQEFQEVFPEAVQGSGEYIVGDPKEILQIDTYNAQVVTIKAVQELVNKIEQLEAENAALRESYKSLASSVEELKKRLDKDSITESKKGTASE